MRFVAGEDDGDSWRAGDALDLIHETELSLENLLIKKEQRAERLVLSGRGNVALDRKVSQERADLFFAHRVRMAFVVEDDETSNPIDVSLFGADAVMLNAQMPADAVEELGRWG